MVEVLSKVFRSGRCEVLGLVGIEDIEVIEHIFLADDSRLIRTFSRRISEPCLKLRQLEVLRAQAIICRVAHSTMHDTFYLERTVG